MYLLEGFYVRNIEKIRTKMGNKHVGKKINTPKGKYLGKYLFTFGIRFLADRTNGRAIATLLRLSSDVCRLSSSVTLCIVAKRCVVEQK